MNLIGLIAALPEERGALLRRIPGWNVCRLGAFRGFRFRLSKQDCLLIESGVGLKRAGEATHALLAESPRLLLTFGVAGAVQADLRIGDVVAVRHTCRLEQGSVSSMAPLSVLPDEARQAAEQALQARGARLVDGVAVTTRGEQNILWQPSELENPVLEMETAGIAAAALQAGVPLLALRGISDNPQEPIPLDPGAVLDSEYRLKIGKLLGILLRRPQILLQFRRFQRNTTLAANNAAAAVLAVISAMHNPSILSHSRFCDEPNSTDPALCP